MATAVSPAKGPAKVSGSEGVTPRRCGSVNGSGRNNNAFSTLNTVELAPTPVLRSGSRTPQAPHRDAVCRNCTGYRAAVFPAAAGCGALDVAPSPLHSADADQCRTPRFFSGYASLEILFDQHLQMCPISASKSPSLSRFRMRERNRATSSRIRSIISRPPHPGTARGPSRPPNAAIPPYRLPAASCRAW
jgi:hypothetical protein